MEGVLAWGIDVIQAIQVFANPGLTVFMKALTLLGSEYFYILILPIVFWCVDERFGARFGLVFLFSSFVNSWLKVAFAQPRPFNLEPSVGLSHESSYGLPSGHAQGTSTFWGLLAPRIRKPWGLVLAVVIPLVIGFTRVYLGVHFPTDVFLGLALGWGIAIASALFGERVVKLVSTWNTRVKIAVVAVLALGMNALNMADTSMSGAFFGTAAGVVFLFSRLRFDATSGSAAKKAIRLLAGLVVLAVIYLGGKAAFPREGQSLYTLFRFIRYGLMGFWVSFGGPWLFLRLKLADRRIGSPKAAGTSA
jgi:membrane-associated phospholipid phosphatase